MISSLSLLLFFWSTAYGQRDRDSPPEIWEETWFVYTVIGCVFLGLFLLFGGIIICKSAKSIKIYCRKKCPKKEKKNQEKEKEYRVFIKTTKGLIEMKRSSQKSDQNTENGKKKGSKNRLSNAS